VHTINGLSRSIITPAVHRFPQLGKVSGQRLGKLGWVHMQEVDRAATTLLREQWYSGNRLSFIPDYPTFELWTFVSRKYIHFPWLTHDEVDGPQTRTCVEVASVRKCPFTRDNLFVPSGWAHRVLRLVGKGIVTLDVNQRRTPMGVTWRGEEYSTQELALILLKE
jgi:hypothetical protein